MQALDPKSLFSIFEQGDEAVYKEHGLTEVLNNPFVLMGTVVRGIENYGMLDLIYTKQFPKDYPRVRGKVKKAYFNKMYGYLDRLDSKEFDDKYEIGTSFDYQEVIGALSILLTYFEEVEHYEKCAVIKNYIDHILDKVFNPDKLL